MKNSNSFITNLIKKHWPFLLIFLIVFVFFWKFFLKGLLPIPADFIVGVYYPWLDYKWFGYGAGVPVKNPLLADIPSLIYPVRIYAMELIKNGQIPLWNPLQFAGYPLLATFQASVLNPLNIIFLFFKSEIAWSLQIVLQPLFASIFAYLFLRHLNLSKLASVLGGFIYAFSGFSIIWLEYNVHGHVAAVIPLILLAVDKIIKEKSFLWGVVLSSSIAFQILAGYPQVTMYTAIVAFVWFLFRARKSKKHDILVKGVTVGTFSFLGIALSSIQLIPGLELLANSQRVSEGVLGGLGIAFLPWEHLSLIFAPDYFGNPATGNYWGRWNIAGYSNANIYAGIIPFVLATYAFIKLRKNKTVKFFLVLYITTIIVSLPLPPVIAVYSSELFGLKSAVATRVHVVSNLSIAVLAAYGFHNLDKLKNRDAIRSIYVPLVVLLGLGLGTFFSRYYYVNQGDLGNITDGLGTSLDFFVVNSNVALRNLILPSFVLIASAILFMAISKAKKARFVLKLLIFSLTVFELFRFGWKFTTFSEPGFLYPRTKVFDYLLEKGPSDFRMVGGDVLPISMWIPFGLQSPSGYDAVYPERWAKMTAVINSGNVNATPMGRYGAIKGYGSKLFDLTNSKYVLALKRDKNNKPDLLGDVANGFSINKLEEVFEDRTVLVLENKDVLPRAFFVTDWETVSADEVLPLLLNPEFDLSKKIVIEENFDEFASSDDNIFDLEILEYRATKIIINLENQYDGFLFLADSYYPGWEAKVNGNKKKIFVADYTYRAIPVQKGRNKVEFIYQPKSFRIGLWFSGATLLFLTVVLAYDQKEKIKKIRKRASQKRSS